MFTSTKPLLLLDVDGVFNPFPLITRKGHRAGPGYTRHDLTGVAGFPDGLPVLLNPDHGTALRALAQQYTLVWATTWLGEANERISPLVGLPTDLPVVPFPASALETHRREGRCGSWKTPHIADWLAEHAPTAPWVWLDDEVNRYDRAWFANWYTNRTDPVRHLVRRVGASKGLVEEDFTALADWATALQPRG